MAARSKHGDGKAPVAVNRKAYHNYELTEKFEAGMSLLGSEVKSLRAGQADLDASYARIEAGQCYLVGAKIAQWQAAGTESHEPSRRRRLLLHGAQIRKIAVKLQQRGFTLVPLRIYFNARDLAKVELALAYGKRKYDKRARITEEQQKRDIGRDLKRSRR